ncbi:MAG: outer membrane beta-barrel protein [Pseudomonadales bacterium]|nr:outer membrane beta-barrel protein [Pseudomonadales bacterium]NRA16429.1 outer membrane beta-barrel protein [Oceanospirillaceae bacterium]
MLRNSTPAILSVVSSFLLFNSTSVLAVEPAAVPLGEMNFYPSLNFATGHDDNILAEETGEKSSSVTRITPNFLLEAETDNTLYRLNYSIEKGILHSSNSDNYLDHNLTGTANIIGNSRNRIDLQVSTIKGHEARGDETGSATATDAPLKFDLNSLQAIYTYGGEEAKGQVELRAAYEDKDFTNFSSVTDSRDFDKISFGAQFNYRVTAKTSALFQATQNKIDYDDSNKDNTNRRFLVGATWEATAKTSGTVKVGWADKDFKDSSLKDTDGGTWDASINWNPKTYSTFIFSTGQEFGESTTADSHIDSSNYGLKWNHYWNDNLKTTIGYTLVNEDFSGSTQDDDTKTLLLGINHETRRWLNLGLGYTMVDKDSNVTGGSFKKNILMFTVQGSL